MNEPNLNSQGNRTYIIAEMACSHEGDASLARKIIDGAGQAGADAIQFQIWSLKDTVVPHHPDYGMLQKIELSADTWRELASYSRQRYPSMHIIACVYDASSVDFAESIDVDAYKLNSQDLSNPNLIEHVARKMKRIDLSTGASTIAEIQSALERIAAARPTSGKPDVWLMYGYQGFPTPTDAINLSYMMKLKGLFELPIGYQDHSDGDSEAAFWLPAAALGMGVDVLEKHITHDRAYKGIDHQAALNPDEFARFVAMVREIEAAKGSSTPRVFSPEELKYRKYAKKSIVAARDLPVGQTVGPNDLLFMRADSLGMPPDQTHRLIGRSTKRTIPAYHLINEDDVN
jgi:sialic acid synthase SpsE